MTTATNSVQLTVTNNTGQAGFIAIIGLDANSLWAYVNADGTSTEFSTTATNNYSLAIPTSTNQLTVSVPWLVSGQIYFSLGQAIVIGTNADPHQPGGVGLVLPAAASSGDPNYNVAWDVAEFTFNAGGLNCDVTQVDAFGLPLSMTVAGDSTQSSGGWSQSMSDIFTLFQNDATVAKLIVANGGTSYRVLNPSHGIDNGVFPADWFDAYITQWWPTYTAANPLQINIAGGAFAGNYLGTVASGTNQPMTITLGGTQVGTIGYPSTSQAFYCNGVFDQGNTAMGAVANVVATAINR
ncbi:MAG TPA: beta-1,3-glucanase family protein, partial [Thermoanaerobaculia bacterium]|nr:beta-1,3-glucanase family protein [Thermoanaerobaculia bacterium]